VSHSKGKGPALPPRTPAPKANRTPNGSLHKTSPKRFQANPPRPPSRFDVARDAVWQDNKLVFRGRVVAALEPESSYPNMWRVRLPGGHVTDIVNLIRAKDAAVCLAAPKPHTASPGQRRPPARSVRHGPRSVHQKNRISKRDRSPPGRDTLLVRRRRQSSRKGQDSHGHEQIRRQRLYRSR
jgi:hypothetical protein